MKILFYSELVTLAHLARPLDLISGLPPGKHEIHLASDDRYRGFVPSGIAWHRIRSISPAEFENSLATGKPPYETATLEEYLKDDLRVIAEVKPDLIVGDMRLSLCVAAKKAGIPVATLSNLHWCPTRRPMPYPLPSTRGILFFRLMPPSCAGMIFRAAQPAFFRGFLKPINRFRTRNGEPPFALLQEAYTAGDHTLYADFPGWIEAPELPRSAHVLGPTLWSPPIPLPAWWEEIPAGRDCIFVNVGSSGDARALARVLEGLKGIDADLLVATAGKIRLDPKSMRKGVWVSDFIPGEMAARRSCLVICNGGSPSVHQALACGKPVLGMPGNLDQFLNMQGLLRSGAGLEVRSDRFSLEEIADKTERLFREPGFRESARRFETLAASGSARSTFRKLLEDGDLIKPGSPS